MKILIRLIISDNKDDMNDFREEPIIYSRENFRKIVKIIPYVLTERHFSVHVVINLTIIVYAILVHQVLLRI